MSMFCFQCQETAKGQGCIIKGACGKDEQTAKLQDLLIHTLKGISLLEEQAISKGEFHKENAHFIVESLFSTITNANFDAPKFVTKVEKALKIRNNLKKKYHPQVDHDSLTWEGEGKNEFFTHGGIVGVQSTENEDVRSLRELLIYGLKGVAAYAHHAKVLGYENNDIYKYLVEGLASTTKDLTVEEMVGKVLKAGEVALETMELLDKANVQTYGNPELSKVNIGVSSKPGILISGHDLKDMEQLLKQTEGKGVDVYTHGEMLPANYYPTFKKYAHLKGNYGGSWWKQGSEFETFNGPILMTTNCITPVKDSYKERIFTTGMAGYEGVAHIEENGGKKDFSKIIELALSCPPPKELESGEIVGGFAHNQVLALADKVVDAVKSGAISKFVVMAGCDGRHKNRSYFTDLASELPKDAVILTAGCAKYRYNKLDLGDIGGIPRVLDAGQCNDSYSLILVASKLKEVFGLKDINELPIAYDIGWYEQKAVAVLLALLHLGVKGIKLGPTLPAFLSENVVKVLVENFNIAPTTDVKSDLKSITT